MLIYVIVWYRVLMINENRCSAVVWDRAFGTPCTPKFVVEFIVPGMLYKSRCPLFNKLPKVIILLFLAETCVSGWWLN